MTYRFSAGSLLRNAFSGHKNWPQQIRHTELKAKYQAVIIGGGGHGLSAAYHLAREFGITSVAVIEKGWIGGGNTGIAQHVDGTFQLPAAGLSQSI